ncbi:MULTISPECIES: hypothetical protein [Serratia]|jgi:hypothetical protein|nr:MULTISPECIES: hypothetical protein [Serratia]MBH2708094.1 hypothetical protein [Serratia marcescens]CAI2438712.1 Uncharacterised protein [Serratia marcescens]CAI2780864.1 Uncharacterised protein [Serratia marcescens]HDU8664595.1 hypothetical protein [Serratia liquefaciens]
MEQREIKIVAEGVSNEDVLKWMQKKVSASRNLQVALAERKNLQQALVEVEKQITLLTNEASVEVCQSS